jgi:hypothetical protein
MASTEVIVVGGERYRVDGDAKHVERLIVSAARGSIMELVWLDDVENGDRVAINPEHVVALRPAGSEAT